MKNLFHKESHQNNKYGPPDSTMHDKIQKNVDVGMTDTEQRQGGRTQKGFVAMC